MLFKGVSYEDPFRVRGLVSSEITLLIILS